MSEKQEANFPPEAGVPIWEVDGGHGPGEAVLLGESLGSAVAMPPEVAADCDE